MLGTDLEVLYAIGDGNKVAFRTLYQRFSEKVYNTAISYTQNQFDAEEVTQDVFMNIFRNAGGFKGKSAVSTWIYRITVNCSLNVLDKRKRRNETQPLDGEIEKPTFYHPGAILENKELSAALFSAIETLPEQQQTAFILSYIEHLPRKEVADIMEISLKAVESLLQRGKVKLRLILEKIREERRN